MTTGSPSSSSIHLLGRVDRAQQVLRILRKHGFGPLTDTSWASEDAPERLKAALIELGTPAVKLGQFLAQRPDLVGMRVARGLESLHADVPAEPGRVARRQIEASLGQPIETLFPVFDDEALAAGSIGQVHTALLPDGRPVIVKVRRPEIIPMCEVDLAVLDDLARMSEMARMRPELDMPGVVERFRAALERELDFRLEASSIERFHEMFEDDDRIEVPDVIRSHSTVEILTMTRIEGVPFADTAAVLARTQDAEALVETGVCIFLDMIHEGVYHADPHPGNLMITDTGKVGLVDFGLVGWLSNARRAAILSGVHSFRDDDPRGLVSTLLALTDGSRPDRELLARDVRTLLERHRRMDMSEVDVAELLDDLVALLRLHQRRLHPDIAVLLRCVILLDGTARALSPSYSLIRGIERWSTTRRLNWLTSPSVEDMLPTWLKAVGPSLGPLQEIPDEVSDLLGQTLDGELTVRVQPVGLDGAVHRLTVATVIAALLVGGALLLSARVPPVFWDVSVSGMICLLIGGVAAIATLTSMLWHHGAAGTGR